MSIPPFVYQPRIRSVPEETQQQIYLLLCQRVPMTHIARRLNVNAEKVFRFRKAIGFVTHHGRHWTDAERWELQCLAAQNLHISTIAKKLHRSRAAVQHQINELRIQRIHRNKHTYTVAQVSRILQVGTGRIARWIENKLLPANRIPMRNDKKRRCYHRIDALDLYDFLAHPKHWHLYNLDNITDDWFRRDLVDVQRETPRWLYSDDLAARYIVTRHAVNNWCDLGKIPCELIMRVYVFDPKAIEKWVPPHQSRKPYQYGSRIFKQAATDYPELITAKQVAEQYGVTAKTVNEWARESIIPAVVQVGCYRLFDPEQLKNWTPPNRVMNTVAVRAALAERPDLLTVNQVAERFGVRHATVHDWHMYGRITGFKVGRITMFEPEQFIDWSPPYVHEKRRLRAHQAAQGAATSNGACEDRATERRRLEGGGAPGDEPTQTDPQPGGGCESSTVPELAEATK